MPTRILLVDDHRMLRDSLRAAFEKQTDMEVVGEAADGQSVVPLTQKLKPDVAIMDLNLPGMNGIEATRAVVAACPGIKVIALSMRCDKQSICEMFKAGAMGYVTKEGALTELVAAVRTVVQGHIYMSPVAAEAVVDGMVHATPAEQASVFRNLTPTQRQVLQGVAEGKSTKEIAAQLGSSVKTVDSHRQEIMRRLNLHSTAELTKYAVREGITPL